MKQARIHSLMEVLTGTFIGLAVSVVLTVFIVPAAYLITYRKRERALPTQPV